MIGNNLAKEFKEVKCPRCKHKFKTRSKLMMVMCNSCGRRFVKEEIKSKE